MKAPSPEIQLTGFIAKFDPPIGRLIKSVHKKMRSRLPGAIEMVYDNYNALAIGFCPNERPSDAIFSIVLFPDTQYYTGQNSYVGREYARQTSDPTDLANAAKNFGKQYK